MFNVALAITGGIVNGIHYYKRMCPDHTYKDKARAVAASIATSAYAALAGAGGGPLLNIGMSYCCLHIWTKEAASHEVAGQPTAHLNPTSSSEESHPILREMSADLAV